MGPPSKSRTRRSGRGVVQTASTSEDAEEVSESSVAAASDSESSDGPPKVKRARRHSAVAEKGPAPSKRQTRRESKAPERDEEEAEPMSASDASILGDSDSDASVGSPKPKKTAKKAVTVKKNAGDKKKATEAQPATSPSIASSADQVTAAPAASGNAVAAEDVDMEDEEEEGGIRIGDIYLPPPPPPACTFDSNGPRLVITHIENYFFKSYAGKQVSTKKTNQE